MKSEFDLIKIIKDIKKLQSIQTEEFHKSNFKGVNLEIDKSSSEDEKVIGWGAITNKVLEKKQTIKGWGSLTN